MDSENGLTRVEVMPPTATDNGIQAALLHYGTLVEFVKGVLQKDVDFGVIPGTRKPTLLKPGAEKLCKLFGLRPVPELVRCVEDFDKPLFHYHYRVALLNRQGEIVAAGEGNCNSLEGKYQKQQSRIFDLPNTLCKMAQKRAMVAAVLVATGASEFFTQDIEDWQDIVEGGDRPQRQPQPARPQPQRQSPRKETLLAESDTLLKRLEVQQGWTFEQVKDWGQTHLRQHYGTDSRRKLSDSQLADFVEELRTLTTAAAN